MSEFVRVARTKDIPNGEGRLFEVGGRRLAGFNVRGRFHAIDNACAHQQGPLADGDLDGCVVTCPWHGWTYDVTNGQSPDDPDAHVEHFETKVVKGEVMVALPEDSGHKTQDPGETP